MNKQFRSDVLVGFRLGVSVSESADLNQMGLREIHFRLALEEIAHSVLVSGGYLAYGGDLKADGYTAFLVRELERYGRRDRPLLSCLAWTEHRKMALGALRNEMHSIRHCGAVVCLDAAGAEINPLIERGEAPQVDDDALQRRSLTALRRYMVSRTGGRVLIGGKRSGFAGEMPGVLEEALYAFERGQPVYLVGGFGGVTRDIARTLGVSDDGRRSIRNEEAAPDGGLVRGLAQLAEVARQTNYQSLKNGLSEEENRRLLMSSHASEIAALISMGLGRRFTPVH